MTDRPWSTQPVTGAQHDAWMAQERRTPDLWDRVALAARQAASGQFFQQLIERDAEVRREIAMETDAQRSWVLDDEKYLIDRDNPLKCTYTLTFTDGDDADDL